MEPKTGSMNKAVFIDKDGTLIHDVPYNARPELVVLKDGTVEGLQKLQRAGYMLVVITNQSGIAYGYFNEEDFEGVKNKLSEILNTSGVTLDGIFYCPHHPRGVIDRYSVPCDCRKPGPGMIVQAATRLNIDLSRSWMIGDILNDVEAGNQAGCRTVLLNNGNETEWIMADNRKPTVMAGDLDEAASLILQIGES
jgi:D,D-heptose 1,7-bisphosphate phosphatase